MVAKLGNTAWELDERDGLRCPLLKCLIWFFVLRGVHALDLQMPRQRIPSIEACEHV